MPALMSLPITQEHKSMTLHRFDPTYIDNHNDRGIDDEYEFVQDSHEFAYAADLFDEEVA